VPHFPQKIYNYRCGHCKRLTPTWDELAMKMETEYPNDGIVIAKVDVTTNRELGNRFDIKGFPTLMYLAGRKMYSYQGERNIDAFTKYLTNGYLETAAKSVPAPSGWLEQKLTEYRGSLSSYPAMASFIEDLDEIFSRRKNAAGFILVLGIIYGTLFGLVLGMMSKNSKEKKD